MVRVAVIVAPGYEEGETLTIVDVLRRAEVACDMVGLDAREVAGAHDAAVRCDTVFDGSLDAYDMVVLPGGYGGSAAMRDNEGLIAALKQTDAAGKWICAICAAPEVIGRANLLANKTFTCYPTVLERVENPGAWVDRVIVRDGNMVFGQGPAVAYAFSFALLDALHQRDKDPRPRDKGAHHNGPCQRESPRFRTLSTCTRSPSLCPTVARRARRFRLWTFSCARASRATASIPARARGYVPCRA